MTDAAAKTLGDDLKTEIADHPTVPLALLARQASEASAWIRAHPKQVIAAMGFAAAMATTLIGAAWRATVANLRIHRVPRRPCRMAPERD